MKQLQCVIFDLDGVLADTAAYHYKAWKRLADEMGVYFDKDINERLKGIGRMESLDIILENSNKAYTLKEKEELASVKNGYYLDFIKEITPEDLFEGVRDLIIYVKNINIKVVLGSASRNANTIVEKLDVKQYFDYIVDANNINRGKPNPEIFLTGAKVLDITPKNCVVVEDSFSGICAAKSAEMFAVGIGNRNILNNADIVYKKTSDIDINYIRELMYCNNKD